MCKRNRSFNNISAVKLACDMAAEVINTTRVLILMAVLRRLRQPSDWLRHVEFAGGFWSSAAALYSSTISLPIHYNVVIYYIIMCSVAPAKTFQTDVFLCASAHVKYVG